MLVYIVMAIGAVAVILAFLVFVRYLDASHLKEQRQAWARDNHFHL